MGSTSGVMASQLQPSQPIATSLVFELEPITGNSVGLPPFLNAVFELDDPTSGILQTRTIAPVGIGNASEAQSPLLNQLLRNTVPIKFDNHPENYEDWKWEFHRTCDRLA